jgi:hypothetical protein
MDRHSRHLDEILGEWRAAERELDATPEDERESLETRIYELREEYRIAIGDRKSVPQNLADHQSSVAWLVGDRSSAHRVSAA